jgi:hypothetical protein
MPANGPGITSFNLRMGVDEFLYSNLSATGAAATFGLPPQMSNYRGVLVVQIVGIAATPTTVTGQLETSLIPEGQTGAFGVFNKLVIATPATLCAYSGLAFVAATVSIPIALDVSGMGGSGKLRFNFTTVTLGGASGFNVFARIG